jgi:hypothetical protein
MKTTIMIRENRTQLVLEPESRHDEDVLKVMERLPGCYRDRFYDCQGGWTREGGGERDLVIVFGPAPMRPKP